MIVLFQDFFVLFESFAFLLIVDNKSSLFSEDAECNEYIECIIDSSFDILLLFFLNMRIMILI